MVKSIDNNIYDDFNFVKFRKNLICLKSFNALLKSTLPNSHQDLFGRL